MNEQTLVANIDKMKADAKICNERLNLDPHEVEYETDHKRRLRLMCEAILAEMAKEPISIYEAAKRTGIPEEQTRRRVRYMSERKMAHVHSYRSNGALRTPLWAPTGETA